MASSCFAGEECTGQTPDRALRGHRRTRNLGRIASPVRKNLVFGSDRAREGTKAMLEYEVEGRAVREKTARLRALRLAKEAAKKNEGVAADSGQPLVARKKANHGC